MPELPEVEAVRRRLAPFLTGTRIADVDVRRPDLRVPFPRRFRVRLAGQTVVSLTRRAKYLLAALSSRDTLIVHLGMSGSFRVDERGVTAAAAGDRDRHDHVVFYLSSGAAITFNDPRRFGLMALLTPADRTSAAYRSSRFRVYDHEGETCLRRQCSGIIRRRTQAGRSTFSCPVCQL